MINLPVITPFDPQLGKKLQAHLDNLTKPVGSLGRLEDLARQLGQISRTIRPASSLPAYLLTFAGDHGVTRHGVSAYPAEVTWQMVANITAGGAASSVLCKTHQVEQRVVDVGVARPCVFNASRPVSQRNVCRGTGDLVNEPAMTLKQAAASIQAGIDEVALLPDDRFAILCLGEMGIGNSTIAALLVCALADLSPAEAVGPGTGVQGPQLQAKVQLVEKILAKYQSQTKDPLSLLAAMGGTEFGAMAGAMLAGAARNWAVVVDGYIAGAAALLAMALVPAVAEYLIWSHCSAEPGAAKMLQKKDIKPLLSLDMRLGEGTGAVLCVPMLRAACAILSEMATFDSAQVSTRA